MILITLAALLGAPTQVPVRLSEWKVELSAANIPAGPVTFVITNAGAVPHAFEVEGRGIERETHIIQPGATDSLTLTLRAGSYEAYCPVGNDSHKRLGMVARFRVGSQAAALPYGKTEPAGASAPAGISVAGGGPVIQILPGPFPFADSAAAVIHARPADQQADLTAKAERGPYSNNVSPISGEFSFSAWDFGEGATRDSVTGVAELVGVDGVRWRVVLDSVQTRDLPNNPRFGGVILGLYYHGASGVHTPLVPTIRSAVALWAWAHLYRNGALVSDHAPVHVMLLSRTRRSGDWALDCWDCSRNPIEELQLQVTSPAGEPKLDAPGGFLFVNWERSQGELHRR
jgi:cupredoxin-like protein